MDAFELLREDHVEIHQATLQLELARGSASGALVDLADDLVRQVLVHDALEGRILQPLLVAEPSMRFSALRHQQDHQEMVRALYTLRDLSPARPEWLDALHHLRSELEHHVRDEESTLFVRLGMSLSAADHARIAAKVLVVRDELRHAAEADAWERVWPLAA